MLKSENSYTDKPMEFEIIEDFLPTSNNLIKALDLQSHPEGGYFKETYRCEDEMDVGNNKRNISTAIYYLLEAGQCSKFHRIKSDELWHFYCGSGLSVHVIDEQGDYQELKLGLDLANGEQPQHMVKAGCWFGASVKQDGFCLVGCTVAPGFDFADFEMANKDDLLNQYPQHNKIIKQLTG